MLDYSQTQANWKQQIEQAINDLVPFSQTPPQHLHAAMRYSLEAGGKRLRPLLILSGHALFKGTLNPLPAAVAVECLHTYSLIHDDLPAIDNSALRRGRKTCHQAFDEATAILAGDALLTHAFYLLSTHYPPALAKDLVMDLAYAASSHALIGGQMEDILAERHVPSALPEAARLEWIHQGKTAALIACSLRLGLRIAGADAMALSKATQLGEALGLAFQIIDDCLDITATPDQLGKNTEQDASLGKLTYVSVYGLEASQNQAAMLTQKAQAACLALGGANSFLEYLINGLLYRKT